MLCYLFPFFCVHILESCTHVTMANLESLPRPRNSRTDTRHSESFQNKNLLLMIWFSNNSGPCERSSKLIRQNTLKIFWRKLEWPDLMKVFKFLDKAWDHQTSRHFEIYAQFSLLPILLEWFLKGLAPFSNYWHSVLFIHKYDSQCRSQFCIIKVCIVVVPSLFIFISKLGLSIFYNDGSKKGGDTKGW